ncbi:MAG: 2-hydroxyacid dehydrogenase [Desulfurococcales archaeon]|nr:2-hydroxyacid dehydrogenase [Desulfurococcales archaeon]
MPRFVVVSMSPLPEALIESYFAPYLEDKDLEVEVVGVFGKPREEVKEALRRADVVIGDYTFQMKIDEDLCSAMEKVRLIQQPSTGFDHIDVEACRRRGIPVANAGGANAVSVAEYTIMAALALLKRLVYAHERTREGAWPQWELMDMGTYDLYGRTWGIIGLGRIGREVTRRLKPWGVRILYHDKARMRDLEEELGVEYRTLRRLLRESDVVSIHVPLTPETRGMIGERELRAMKPGAILVNPSRGELVDEEALAKALREGWIGGAAVDVYSREPPGSDHPLIRLAREGGVNLIVTPHIAGANSDARQRIVRFSVENVLRVLMGGEPEAVVNM